MESDPWLTQLVKNEVIGNFTLDQRSLRGRLALSNKAMPTATAIPP
jgi:hypothetical protein